MTTFREPYRLFKVKHITWLFLMFAPMAFAEDVAQRHCIDPDQRFGSGFCEKVQTLLEHHFSATDEDIWVEVVDGPEKAREAFNRRNADSPRRNNLKMLLAVEPGLFRGDLYVAVGLDDRIPENSRADLVASVLGPLLRDHRPELAVSKTIEAILERLESPLIEEGEAGALVVHAEGIPLRGSRPSWMEVTGGVLAAGGVAAYYLWTLRRKRKESESDFSDSTRGDQGPTGASSAEWSPQDDLQASDTGSQSRPPRSGGES